MARLSRLLSAVCLGIVATAAMAAVAVGSEYSPVRRTPTHFSESTSGARVIVKFRERASVLSASRSSTGVMSGPQKASVIGSRMGLSLTDGRTLGERTQVMMASGMTSAALAKTLATDSDVEWAEVDHRRFVQSVVNDPLYPDNLTAATPASGQWYLRAPGMDASGRDVQSSINIEPAWAITKGSTAIVIGDVDTGITKHPDLDSKMLPGYDFIGWGSNNGPAALRQTTSDSLATANDGDLADSNPSDPGDWVSATENSTKGGPLFGCNDNKVGGSIASTSTWHGTQTAGVLGAATNNGVGMAGVAYAVPLVPARALGKCGGWDSDIIAAAEWAGGIAVSSVPVNAHPARVINMSLGGDDTCTQAYVDALTALRNKGVVVVAAAGNGNAANQGIAVGTPANCRPAAGDADQTPIVVAVGALRHAGTKVGFSNLGPEVTISAPGGNCVLVATVQVPNPACLYPILTAVNSGTTTPVTNGGTYSNSFGDVSLGTSFSTPLVAGTVALMLSANPSLSNADVIRILKATARPFPVVSDTTPQPPVCTAPTGAAQDECLCTTSTCGAGMLDAGEAVKRVWAEAGNVGVGPVADITSTASTLQVGATLSLSGASSTTGSTGAAITSYAWSLPDNDSLVSLSATSGSSITITGAAIGSTHVALTITDATGATSSFTLPISVTARSSGGGGGAANPAWLAALAIAGLLLGSRRKRA